MGRRFIEVFIILAVLIAILASGWAIWTIVKSPGKDGESGLSLESKWIAGSSVAVAAATVFLALATLQAVRDSEALAKTAQDALEENRKQTETNQRLLSLEQTPTFYLGGLTLYSFPDPHQVQLGFLAYNLSRQNILVKGISIQPQHSSLQGENKPLGAIMNPGNLEARSISVAVPVPNQDSARFIFLLTLVYANAEWTYQVTAQGSTRETSNFPTERNPTPMNSWEIIDQRLLPKDLP